MSLPNTRSIQDELWSRSKGIQVPFRESLRGTFTNQQQSFDEQFLRQYFGYRFGYRHQFALISASYAKLQVGMGLAGLPITLNYAYLS